MRREHWRWGRNFLLYIGRNKSEHTYLRFRTDVKRFLLWTFVFKDKPIDERGKKDILELVDFSWKPPASRIGALFGMQYPKILTTENRAGYKQAIDYVRKIMQWLLVTKSALPLINTIIVRSVCPVVAGYWWPRSSKACIILPIFTIFQPTAAGLRGKSVTL